ncbi:uncharacterized protein BJX67DRAFT_377657 [Aspergillus lucknowensis]|uniref:Uncharacterized protein n=1 Tax=Aspergillus lucknowensis TaxID=176173 RepID=A0ABR4M383_9EURO
MPSIKSHYRSYNHNRNRNRNRNQSPSLGPTTHVPKTHPNPQKRRHNRNNNNSGSSSGSGSRCWTWLLVPGNMHYAKNRSSFSSYRRAPSKIDGSRVLGVGTVELKVRRAPDDDRMNTLVLRDVLHMPGARCNGLCVGKYCEMNPGDGVKVCGEGFQAFSEGESEGEGKKEEEDGRRYGNGEKLWYGEGYHGRSRVVLWGDPHGSEDLEDDGGCVDMPGIDASAEELDTLYTRVRERSLI